MDGERGGREGERNKPSSFLRTRSMAPEQPEQDMVIWNL